MGPQRLPPASSKSKEKARATDSSDDDDELASPEDVYIVAGCADSCLRKFDARNGRCISKMTTDRMGREQTLVWAVGVFSNHAIISGDSMGNVKFWDGNMGTQLCSIRAHRADVLCLAIGPASALIFVLSSFLLIFNWTGRTYCLYLWGGSKHRSIHVFTGNASDAVPMARWIMSSKRRFHSHDVRALAVSPPFVPSQLANLEFGRRLVYL